jgi:DNA (cytosine-5)-methyltransferase 1
MLQPHELARAMSFPKGYKFHGNREQVVKQIGNAVPVNLAKALCGALLRRRKATKR